ncbi:methyltransferase domain-containing protein [Patescibacteria group bacterium]|nr:methyltransferase domain-containing protein [Patescibacteria group bacterium]
MPSEKTKESLQEESYNYPYHFIPRIKDGNFSQVIRMSWGFEYFSYINFVAEQINTIPSSTILDVGCGEGKLLHEINKTSPNKKLVGIDISKRAIGFAKAINPNLDFIEDDICEVDSNEKFDVVTLIETIEHIHPDKREEFIRSIWDKVTENGFLLLTAPSKNVPTIEKHYEHFDQPSLEKCLAPYFKIKRIAYLNKDSGSENFYKKLFTNRFFILNNQKILNWYYKKYARQYLLAAKEDCKRIYALCKKQDLEKMPDQNQMVENPEISIIIGGKIDSGDIDGKLKILFNQKIEKKFEVLFLYDDNGDAKALEVLKKYPVKIITVKDYNKNHQWAKAFNKALEMARGKIIVSLSSFAMPKDEKWLSELIKPINDEIVGVSGKVIVNDGSSPIEKMKIVTSFGDQSQINSNFTFKNAAIKKEFLEKFPIKEDLLCSEDVDILARLKVAEIKILYNPSSQVICRHQFNLRENFQRGTRHGHSYNRQNILRPKLKIKKDYLRYSVRIIPGVVKKQNEQIRKNYKYFRDTNQDFKWYVYAWPYELSYVIGYYLGPMIHVRK